MKSEIFVRLRDEPVLVWRPVHAEHLHGDTYRILDQLYERETERWEFEPGDVVVCESVESADGRILAATRRSTKSL